MSWTPTTVILFIFEGPYSIICRYSPYLQLGRLPIHVADITSNVMACSVDLAKVHKRISLPKIQGRNAAPASTSDGDAWDTTVGIHVTPTPAFAWFATHPCYRHYSRSLRNETTPNTASPPYRYNLEWRCCPAPGSITQAACSF